MKENRFGSFRPVAQIEKKNCQKIGLTMATNSLRVGFVFFRMDASRQHLQRHKRASMKNNTYLYGTLRQ